MADDDDQRKMTEGACAETATRAPVSISVTPVLEHKKEVICDIAPASGYGRGEKIHLKSGKYKLKFTLRPGTPANVTFEPNDSSGNCRAIYFDDGGCPGNKNGTIPTGQQFTPTRLDDTTLEVDADVSGTPAYAIHYRLNFNDNRYFDPVIIHD